MRSEELQRRLTDWSVINSGYDEKRNYIGLSSIADCQRILYRKFFNRTGTSIEQRLRTRASYEIEFNLKERLKAMGFLKPGKEIRLYEGLVQGHTEGEIVGNLFEIKTVPLSEHFPDGKIPAKSYWQCQGYMKYGKYPMTLLLYYGRDDGLFKFYEVHPNEGIMQLIEAKIHRLVDAVTKKCEPICECGKCG